MAVDFVHRHEADIVSVVLVFVARVSQAGDEEHGLRPPSSRKLD